MIALLFFKPELLLLNNSKMLQHGKSSPRRRLSGSRPHPSLVNLNIGGQDFTTTIDTILSHPPSFLSALVTTKLPTTLDSRGNIFVDRDGSRFRVLLNYLRCGTIHFVNGAVPTATGSILLEEVLEEARFFGLDNLVRLIEGELNRIELENSLESMFRREKLLKSCANSPVKDTAVTSLDVIPHEKLDRSSISENDNGTGSPYRIDFDMEF